jgi:hypothetical protein
VLAAPEHTSACAFAPAVSRMHARGGRVLRAGGARAAHTLASCCAASRSASVIWLTSTTLITYCFPSSLLLDNQDNPQENSNQDVGKRDSRGGGHASVAGPGPAQPRRRRIGRRRRA